MASIQDVAEFVATGPFGSLLHKTDYVSDAIPIVNPIHLADGRIRHNADVCVTRITAERLSSYRLREGDVLVARRGDIGRCGLVSASNDGWVCGTGCFFIRPKRSVDPWFLTQLLGSPGYRAKLESVSTGTTMRNLSNGALRQLRIRLPPLDEQKRIVAVLDQAFAALDRARANAEANLADANELFDGWLTAIFYDHPNSWRTEKLKQLCSRVTVGHVGPMSKRYVASGTPFLRSQNIRPFELDLDDVKYIDDDFHAELTKSVLRPGDVAIVRTGYPGTAAVIPDSLPVANCADLVILRPNDGLLPEFVVMFLNSSFGKSLVASKAVGAAQKHFNVGAAKDVDFAFPSVDEQSRLVRQCHTMAAQAGALRQHFTDKLADLAALRQSLLQKAFAGELS